jgi:NAD(P)-dependent dehydrogenase (short-subunit alcohol dehydrogenase family)
MGRVDGKVALITGAARGQGRAHALRLAEEGADIIAVDLCSQLDTVPYPLATEADLEETAKQVEDRDRRILTRKADVRDLGQLQAAVADGVSEFGHLDIVCANAGIASMGPAIEISEETWQEMIDVNLTGAWKTVKATAPQMIQQGTGGSIVLTSSIAGLAAFPNLAHYTAPSTG